MKLAIVSTHPIQYNAPLFRRLAATPGLEIMVFYTWSQTASGSQYDPQFGKVISWDIPLLDGYAYTFVENVSPHPGSGHFKGIQNPELIQRIRDWSPSAVLVYGWSFQSHLACMRYFKGRIPVLFRGDSTLVDDIPGLKSSLRRLFLRWVYRHVDIALYAGKANKAYFKACGLQEHQLVFAPHAIDNDRFGSDPAQHEAAARERRAAMGIADEHLVVMFAGKFEAKKDPQFMIRLAAACPNPGLRFLMVGNGALEPALRYAASADQRVIFMDFQNQQAMPVVYRMADVFVLPSVYNETWGLAVNESMACKRPAIVSSKVGCAPDLVEEGVTGWTFDPGTASEQKVAKILEHLYANRQVLQEVGIHAEKKIRSYSYDAVAGGIKAALEIIDRKKQGILQ
jgi:glycosyltransferase involved in cell wall biosynthesis